MIYLPFQPNRLPSYFTILSIILFPALKRYHWLISQLIRRKREKDLHQRDFPVQFLPFSVPPEKYIMVHPRSHRAWFEQVYTICQYCADVMIICIYIYSINVYRYIHARWSHVYKLMTHGNIIMHAWNFVLFCLYLLFQGSSNWSFPKGTWFSRNSCIARIRCL